MTEIARFRLRVVLGTAAVAAFSAAALPAPAAADDGLDPLSPPAAEIGTIAEGPATLDDVVATVVDQAEQELDTAVEAATDAVAPGATEATAAEDDEPSESAASTIDGGDSASTDASEHGTTADSGDTATDSTAPTTSEEDSSSEAAPTPSQPVAAPSAPPAAVNVNVSVRINSPGDNASVVQENTTASAGGPGTLTSSTTPGPTTPLPTAASGAPSLADIDSSSWYWQWDCLSMPTIPVVSPTGSDNQSLPTSWTWIWNCANNSPQYHSDSPDQYQQINNNVSIRISSPGANGAVTQTNVRVSTDARAPAGSPRIPATIVAVPAISVPSIRVTAPPVTITIPPVVIGWPAELGSQESGGEGPVLVAADVAITIDAGLGIAVVDDAEDSSGIFVPRLGDVGLARRPDGLQPAHVGDAHAYTPTPPLGASVASAVHRGASPYDAGRPADRPAERGDRRATPAPRWAPGDTTPLRSAPRFATAGATASAAGAGGSPGGGLPIFLALPFLAVVLDLARRVALERATWPSGHRRRVPDTPG